MRVGLCKKCIRGWERVHGGDIDGLELDLEFEYDGDDDKSRQARDESALCVELVRQGLDDRAAASTEELAVDRRFILEVLQTFLGPHLRIHHRRGIS